MTLRRVSVRQCAIVIAIGLALVGCKGGSHSNSPDAAETIEMSKLAQMNGCFECHRIDATVVGPSFKAIAERYKDAPLAETRALLIASINKGSVGQYSTWKGGQGMPPLERRVSADHIQRLVDYILSLRPQKSTMAAPPTAPETDE